MKKRSFKIYLPVFEHIGAGICDAVVGNAIHRYTCPVGDRKEKSLTYADIELSDDEFDNLKCAVKEQLKGFRFEEVAGNAKKSC